MIDVRKIVSELKTIESLAWIPRVTSTNAVARRVAQECVENEIHLPSAMILAGEQLAGKGRGDRSWDSPAGAGVYATTLYMRGVSDFALIPLEVANLVAGFLRDDFSLDARIKWPNDILVDEKKIAGILIDARMHEEKVFLLIGTGINVLPGPVAAPNATSIAASLPHDAVSLPSVITSFIRYVDAALSQPFNPAEALDRWRSLTVHKNGDPVNCRLTDRTVSGTWEGIDDAGRALIRSDAELIKVSAGDLMVMS